jgi:hypothetical protein
VPHPAVLNSGLHTGPAVLLVQTWANRGSGPAVTPIPVGEQTVSITQPAGIPAAPEIATAVAGDRIDLSWTPAIGAGINWFILRGAVGDGAMTDLLTLPGYLRAWRSPALPPGSYRVELVAANDAGRSVPSNPTSFSVGLTAAPDPPVDLLANVDDDQVALSWSGAPAGPAPSGFVVEAAALFGEFAAVARTAAPSFVANRVPPFTWRVRIRATTHGGISGPSAEVLVTAAACSTPPDPPRDPWALWTAPAVTLRWSAPLRGAVEHYVIEIGSALGHFDLGRLEVPGTQLSVTEQVQPGLTRFVRVRARNACGESQPSAWLPVVVPPLPPPGPLTFLLAMVLDENGVCIEGAAIQVVRGQRLGETIVQTTPCSEWDYGGGVEFREVMPGVEMTLRAVAPGYAAKEMTVIPKLGPQTALLFWLSRQ